MTVQIFKPNIDVIRQQAQQAREAEQKRKAEGEFRWFNMEDGDNVFRLLPPTNSRGLIFKRVCNHYFRDTPFQGKIERHRCIVQTHEDIPNVSCPICDIGDRILAQRPDLKIGRWHSPGVSYYGQGIIRKDPTPLPLAQLVRCTSGVKNWVTQQVEQAWGQGIDITDFNAGLDINVVKGEKVTKRGKRTEYKPAIASLMGPTPILTHLPEGVTLEQVVNRIVESMYDPDEIWKFPDDEAIVQINKAASDIYSYYMKDAYSHPGAQVQVPGTLASRLPTAVTPGSAPAVQQPALPPAATVQQPALPPAPPAPISSQMTAQHVANAAVAVAQGQPQPQLQAPTPQLVQQQSPPTQSHQAAPASNPSSAPTDRPACWAGAAPREDGEVGYNDESEYCLMCPHELTCMDNYKAGTPG